MAIARCGSCSIPFLREEIVEGRCPLCGSPLCAPAATARNPALSDEALPGEIPGLSRRAVLLAVLVPLILAAGLYLAFRCRPEPAGAAGPAAESGPLASVPAGGTGR